jgi:Domain of unknown function (DUF802)
MNKHLFNTLAGLGALAVAWVGVGFASSNPLALAVTLVIGAIYGFGTWELRQFHQTTQSLSAALADLNTPPLVLGDWLNRLPVGLQNPVRLRVEGESLGLPGPALTPYLVGLLVMLGMLGTFLGMVVTLNGAVFALEATTDLQAIRTAFASPIKGLGLAFGTSVAGVASSAVLGLLATLCRRERQHASQWLDTKIATVLRDHSLTHQRQATFTALQQQAQALPALAEQMQAMMAQMQFQHQALNTQLLQQQERFHQEAAQAYQQLAQSVDQTLQRSLTHSMQLLGERLHPMVQSTMDGLARESTQWQQRVLDATQAQLHTMANHWHQGLATQEQAHLGLVGHVQQTLQAFADSFDQRAHGLIETVGHTYTRLHTEHATQERQQWQDWTASLDHMASTLTREWQQSASQQLAQQQHVNETLHQTAQHIGTQLQTSTGQTLADLARLMAASEALAQSRIDTETRWLQQHGERMDQWTTVLRTELATLRDDEAQRGAAAVERLGELQAAVASHLTTLGAALEGPITRLVQTTAEVPQAAAELIGQLRQEMSNSLVRDNALLEERSRTLTTLHQLLDTIQHASTEQRAVIDALVASAAATLNQASDQFAHRMEAEADKLTGMAQQLTHSSADITSSAVDVSSLSEALGVAVRSFHDANEQLITHLQRIEGALNQSMARSDEQLAYYVAQAREIIDLSVTSQKEVVDELRQLRTV